MFQAEKMRPSNRAPGVVSRKASGHGVWTSRNSSSRPRSSRQSARRATAIDLAQLVSSAKTPLCRLHAHEIMISDEYW